MQEKYLQDKTNKGYSLSEGRFFTVFRIGDKLRHNPMSDTLSIEGLAKFEKHNLRQVNVKNADSSKKKFNRILIGSENIQEDLKAYLEGVKIGKRSIIGRELVLSAGNGFWNRMLPQDQEKWIQNNVDFLKDKFGDNCISAILHMDESNVHIHALVTAVQYEEGKIPKLNDSMYFGSREKFIEWQDSYTNAMSNGLNFFIRGVRGSKAKHIDLKTFYALINEDLNELNKDSILAHAKENFLNRKKSRNYRQLFKIKKKLLN